MKADTLTSLCALGALIGAFVSSHYHYQKTGMALAVVFCAIVYGGRVLEDRKLAREGICTHCGQKLP